MSTRRPILDERLRDRRVCICVGSGGVGKTTISAALALGLAQRGSKVALLSIDPAKRLACALGAGELTGEPRMIDQRLFEEQGIEMRGELWAMMLDSKGTFDQLIARLSTDERRREEIYANRIYRELSSAVAGTQEFTAVAKLYELHREMDFDVIVLDTPPSANALDFLDAPTRLMAFFDGRALRAFLAPGGAAARLLGRGTSLVFAAFARLSGIDLMGDLSAFFGSLSGVLDGFRQRVTGVSALLRDPASAFVIVASPESDPVAEAVFVHRELAERSMPYAGLIVNRVHEGGLGEYTTTQVSELLSARLGERLAARTAQNLQDFDVLVRRDRSSVEHLRAKLAESDPVLIPHIDSDLTQLAGLANIARYLFEED